MKYTLIEKQTGKFYNIPTMFADTSMPINEDVLMYVELTENQVAALTNHNIVIDVENSKYIDGQWVESYITPEKSNILENRIRDLNFLKTEAARRLTITDISDNFKIKIEQYLMELNTITLTADELQQIIWPSKPW